MCKYCCRFSECHSNPHCKSFYFINLSWVD